MAGKPSAKQSAGDVSAKPAVPTVESMEEWPPQVFHVSHLRDEDFKADGLRPYALYRDLGMAEATGGMVDAHVNRRARPFKREDVSKRHYHDLRFQMVYVLKGWVRNEFDGHGEFLMREGSCWIQPAGIKHTVLEYSDDLEVLEIVIPAKYDTVEVDEPPGG
jgi:mannose-6-phosphate isomerase-like protein (cupin superfamily)